MPLSGTWYNELNSEMNLHVQAVSNGGSLVTGAYITKVGNAAGTYSLGA